MIGAGLLAKKAVEAGLRAPAYVKTSLAPGSQGRDRVSARCRSVALPGAARVQRRGLWLHNLHRQQRAATAPEIAQAVTEGNLVAVAVLSGNRNFEGRIHPLVKANYLASPPLVVAYALAGHDGH